MYRLKHVTKSSMIFSDGMTVKEVCFSDGDCIVKTFSPVKDDITGEVCEGIVYEAWALPAYKQLAISDDDIACGSMSKPYTDKFDNDEDLPDLAEILGAEVEITPEIEDCFYNLSGGGINTIYHKAESSKAAATLGRLGGKAKTEAKRKAAAENGKKGGRPGTKKYLYVSPRGFSNEYSIYSVDTDSADQVDRADYLLEKADGDPNFRAKWITRKEAEGMTAHNRRLYRAGEASCQNPAGATEILGIMEY